MKPLFNRFAIFGVMEYRKQQLKTAFQSVPTSELDADPIALVARLIEECSISVPVLDEDKKYALTKETKVDVSRDPRRFISDRSQPFYIGGTEVRIVVPFHGDTEMFDAQPTMFTLNPPFAEIHENEVHLVYELTDAGFDIDGATTRTIGQINQYLQSLRGSAEQLKTDLQQLLNVLIEQRKRERKAHSQIVAGLKIPVKEAPTTPLMPPRSAYSMGQNRVIKKPQEEWDVFISHASEDKDAIATPLARVLQEKGLRVWYDDFSLRLGDSLRESIDRGLARSQYGVVILSGYFFGKHWPQQELNGLATREVDGQNVILPVWHGVGFAEVRGYSVTLADRKAVQTKDGLANVVDKIMEVVGEPQD